MRSLVQFPTVYADLILFFCYYNSCPPPHPPPPPNVGWGGTDAKYPPVFPLYTDLTLFYYSFNTYPHLYDNGGSDPVFHAVFILYSELILF